MAKKPNRTEKQPTETIDKAPVKKPRRDTKTETVPIIGIGASAGGLEALEGLFAHMPSDISAAFVVIQHLDPKHKSIMGSLLRKYTSMRIVEIEDGMKLEPNCVYLNPPNKNVVIMDRRLHLRELLPIFPGVPSSSPARRRRVTG